MLTVCCWPIVKNHMVMVSTILRAWIPVSHLGCFSSKAVDSSAFCILHVGKVKHKATSHEWAPRARTRSRCRRVRRRSPRPARAWWRGRRWGWRWSPQSSTWTHISANISIQLCLPKIPLFLDLPLRLMKSQDTLSSSTSISEPSV